MQQITTFEQANKLLRQFVPAPREYIDAKQSLDNMRVLMQALGNPQDQYKAIHVAGTSGKTSTAYYVASLLIVAGQKVGLTVSPHVDEVNERMQINLAPPAEQAFCESLSEFLQLLSKIPVRPSYFELLVAFAYWEFARRRVDYAVIEVGMGGVLDATNVITRPDKVCVLTDIGLDHTKFLGHTPGEVASQKAGIIGSGSQVFMYQQGTEVMQVIRSIAARQKAKLNELQEASTVSLLPALPSFQRRNWYLASQVYGYVQTRDNLVDLNDDQLLATTATYIPARMEVVKLGDKTIIMDGAHNGQKLHALVTSIKEKYPGASIAGLVGFSEGEEQRVSEGLNQLMPILSAMIITTFDGVQDTPKQPVSPEKVQAYARAHGFKDSTITADPVTAFSQLMSRPEKILLVTGSFFLLNHIRPRIRQLSAEF